MTTKRRPRTSLVVGALAAAVSAAGTYLFPVSIALYPLFVAAFLFGRRRLSAAAPGHRRAELFGLTLGVSALLMPVLTTFSWWAFDRYIQGPGPLITGEPFYFAIYTAPAVALVVCVVLAAVLTVQDGKTSASS